MLGKKIYFLSFDSKEVKEGTIIGSTISSTGYSMYRIIENNGDYKTVEKSKCFKEKEDAEKNLIEKLPLAEKMDEIIKETEEKLNNLRKQIIGEPDLPEFAERK